MKTTSRSLKTEDTSLKKSKDQLLDKTPHYFASHDFIAEAFEICTGLLLCGWLYGIMHSAVAAAPLAGTEGWSVNESDLIEPFPQPQPTYT